MLVILVLNDRDVQNRVIHLDQSFSDQELAQAANLLNQEFGGRPLNEMREAVMSSMRADRARMDEVLHSALTMAESALPAQRPPTEDQELVVSGERRLLDFTADTDIARALFDAISRKGRVLHLLDQCLQSSGVQLYIGQESGYRPLGDMSLVTSSYESMGS